LIDLQKGILARRRPLMPRGKFRPSIWPNAAKDEVSCTPYRRPDPAPDAASTASSHGNSKMLFNGAAH
jgi:hypothetical protein